MFSIPLNVYICRYLDLKQYMVYLFLSKYRNQLFYSYPVLELELFQLGTESVVSVCRAVQKLEIVLSNFYPGLFQMLPKFI